MRKTDRITGMPLVIESEPAPKRCSPRKRSGRPVIKIRLTAESQDDAELACAVVEELLATLQCRMQAPRPGGNPRYADDPKVLAYGDFELPPVKRRRSAVKRKRV
jgi:hypothetical protein